MSKSSSRVPSNLPREIDACLRNAQQFLRASARCMEAEVVDQKFSGPFEVPAVVNAAFAVELAFKTLLLKGLTIGQPAPSGHELDDLFLRLTPAQQSSLRACTPAPTYPRPAQQASDPFFDVLTQHGKAFVEWRYVHEATQKHLAANLTFLTKLAEGAIALASV